MKITLISVFFILSANLFSQEFKIVFMADLVAYPNPSNPGNWANNDAWLDEIEKWGATGINLVVPRWAFEPKIGEYHDGVFQNFGRALKRIADRDLDIYVRVSMGLFHDNWRSPSIGGKFSGGYTLDDVHQTSDGNGGTIMMDNYHSGGIGKPVSNITSERSRNDLLRFFRDVLSYIDKQGPAVKEKIKLIVPTFSPDDETEYPSAISGPHGWGYLSGYSEPELREFHKYLRLKYNGTDSNDDITKLKSAWGSGLPFDRISEIDPRHNSFNWHRESKAFNYPAGRKDFLDFRTQQLKKFIDDCAVIAKGKNYKLGVQFGSINDAGIEFRGTSDFTKLLENVDHFVVDDIPEYAEKDNFANDLAKSACDAWKSRNGKVIAFSTETNWPGYAPSKFDHDQLVENWNIQLQEYYESGAEALFISHWGTGQFDIAPRLVAKSLPLPGVKPLPEAYEQWRRILNSHKGKQVK